MVLLKRVTIETVNSKDLVASASPFHNRATRRLFEVQALNIFFSSVPDCLKKIFVIVVVVVVATSSEAFYCQCCSILFCF